MTGHKNGNIRFWDTESGRLVTTLSSHKSQVNALAFSPLPNSQNTSTYNDDSLLRLISVGSDLALKVITLYNRVILNVSYFNVSKIYKSHFVFISWLFRSGNANITDTTCFKVYLIANHCGVVIIPHVVI